jgi:Tfp pilus assembly protein PilN
VRAVNLIPSEGRRASGGSARAALGPAHAVLGLLAVALAFVTIYVLSSNTVSDRKAKLAGLQAQVAEATAQAAQLTKYTQFQQLAQTRAETVREIAGARFNWQSALANLSRVVPANTSLQSLLATVAPGTSTGGTGSGGGTSNLRGDISAPAFELRGCTNTQQDVARLMSRLRTMDGVTRVSLSDSQKGTGSATSTVTTTVAAPSTAAASTGCKPNAPTFDLVVFFQAVPLAGPDGLVVPAATTPATGAGATATPATGATATPATTGTTTPATGTTTPSATAPATSGSATPVSTTTPTGGTK